MSGSKASPRIELIFNDSDDKPHRMQILDIAPADATGMSLVRYVLDDETFTYPVKEISFRFCPQCGASVALFMHQT